MNEQRAKQIRGILKGLNGSRQLISKGRNNKTLINHPNSPRAMYQQMKKTAKVRDGERK